MHHVTPLPAGTTFESALKNIHDHDLLIRLDPEFAHYETLPSDDATPSTKRYKVTDHMHTLPKGLWDTTVTFESQLTNTEDGVEWIIKAPLGLLQQTKWRIVSKDEQQVTVGTSGHAESPAVIAAVAPATPVLEQQLEYVPDGGRAAWTVVLGSTLALFASAGMINAYVRPFSAYLNRCEDALITTTTGRVSGLLQVHPSPVVLVGIYFVDRVSPSVFPLCGWASYGQDL